MLEQVLWTQDTHKQLYMWKKCVPIPSIFIKPEPQNKLTLYIIQIFGVSEIIF